MKRATIVLLISMLCTQIGFSATIPTVYEPYKNDEFPTWSVKLRRGETLFFGSLPITLSLTGFSYSLAQGLGSGTLSNDPFQESIAIFGIAAGLSLIITLTDYILGEMER